MPSIITPSESAAASIRLRRPLAVFTHLLRARPPISDISRPPLVCLRYGLITRRHPRDDIVDRLQRTSLPVRCYPSYGALISTPAGFSPAEHASLRWTHNKLSTFSLRYMRRNALRLLRPTRCSRLWISSRSLSRRSPRMRSPPRSGSRPLAPSGVPARRNDPNSDRHQHCGVGVLWSADLASSPVSVLCTARLVVLA